MSYAFEQGYEAYKARRENNPYSEETNPKAWADWYAGHHYGWEEATAPRNSEGYHDDDY